jgi:Flp pilus assembly pilin Flp
MVAVIALLVVGGFYALFNAVQSKYNDVGNCRHQPGAPGLLASVTLIKGAMAHQDQDGAAAVEFALLLPLLVVLLFGFIQFGTLHHSHPGHQRRPRGCQDGGRRHHRLG